jgi:acid phosphatase type 7
MQGRLKARSEKAKLTRLALLIYLLAAVLPTGAGAAVVTAAGDIASCRWSGDSATGDLVRAIDPTVALTLGDNVYPDGAPARFANCYDSAWGAFKGKTRPAPGNHDYVTADAAGYFSYFGARAGPCCRGYYKYDVGAWRLYSLNSERRIAAQATWLADDMRAHPHTCTLAYWHRARFSDSTRHGDSAVVDPLWDAFAANGGDVVLAGHDHDYQRFPRIDGVRSFVVGTGGAWLYDVMPERVAAYDDTHRGVLRMGLHDRYYLWKFRRVGAPAFDAGSANCRS